MNSSPFFISMLKHSSLTHMRGLIPLTAGTISGIGWWLGRSSCGNSSSGVVESLQRAVAVSGLTEYSGSLRESLQSLWQLTGLILVWELRWEIRALFWYLITIAIHILHWAYLAVNWLSKFSGTFGASSTSALELEPRSERGIGLTCMAAALVPAGGGNPGAPPFRVGSFVLIARPPEWDEVWLAGYTASGDAICRTTDSAGADWVWVVVKLVPLQVKGSNVQADGSRRSPAGIDANSVNWLYLPPDCALWWNPDAVETVGLTQEAGLISSHLAAHPGSLVVNNAGVGGPLVPVAIGAQNMMAPGGAGAQSGGPGHVGAGLGLGGGGDAAPSAADLKALEAAVAQLQALALSDRKDQKKDKSRKSSRKSRQKSKDRKKGKKKKKKGRKHRRSSSSSSSDSSTSRSRSRSSTSSAKSRKPLKWKEAAKDKSVSYADLSHVDQLKFKKKGDLVNFAARHPGALTAHFLAGVYARLSKGTISRSSQLRDVSVAAWAHQFSGLTEVRDIKEVITLSEILDHVNRREIARALDVLVQRILAIQAAKGNGGSWEKAEALELVNSQKSLASSSMLALTNA